VRRVVTRLASRLIVNGLLVIGAIAIALVLAEAGLRFFYPQPMGVWHHDRDGLALHWPGLVTYLPQFGITVSFNSAGMRDREHAVEKSSGVLRILVLGDSFMEALQIPFEASFPSLLERELAAKIGRPVDVVNASVSGWGTDDELKYLTTYGMRFNPDLVLVAMTLHNDISDNLRERFHRMQDGALSEQPPTTASFVSYKIVQLKGLLATRLHLYQLVIRARRHREMKAEANQLSAHVTEILRDEPGASISRGFKLTELLLQRLQTVAAAGGSRVVLVLLPLGVQVSDEKFAELVRTAGGAPGELEVDRPQRTMKEAANRAGIAVFDLLPKFREWTSAGDSRLYLERDGHWNEAGHRLAAGSVARALIDQGVVR
jgi:GDSL-like lipase/acylhydrolase family protein